MSEIIWIWDTDRDKIQAIELEKKIRNEIKNKVKTEIDKLISDIMKHYKNIKNPKLNLLNGLSALRKKLK